MKFKMVMMIITLMFLAFGLPMIMPGPNGKPMMTLNDWIPDLSGAAKKWHKFSHVVEDQTGIALAPPPPTIHKWQDEKGKWHFGDSAPEGANSEKFVVREANSMEPPPEIEFESSRSTSGPSVGFPSTISPAAIPELIDKAKNVQNLMDQRGKELEKY